MIVENIHCCSVRLFALRQKYDHLNFNKIWWSLWCRESKIIILPSKRTDNVLPYNTWSVSSYSKHCYCSWRGADLASQLHYANLSVTITPTEAFTAQSRTEIYIVSSKLQTVDVNLSPSFLLQLHMAISTCSATVHWKRQLLPALFNLEDKLWSYFALLMCHSISESICLVTAVFLWKHMVSHMLLKTPQECICLLDASAMSLYPATKSSKGTEYFLCYTHVL